MRAFALALVLVGAPALASPEFDACMRTLEFYSAQAELSITNAWTDRYYWERTKRVDILGNPVHHWQYQRRAGIDTARWMMKVNQQAEVCLGIEE